MNTTRILAGALLAGGLSVAMAASGKEINVETIEIAPFSIGTDLFRSVHVNREGDLLILRTDGRDITRIGRQDRAVEAVDIGEAPECPAAMTMKDIATDAAGRPYLGASCGHGKSALDIVMRYGIQGDRAGTVVLAPSLGMRHMTVDDEGNIFALASDARYFRGETPDCRLVHKYSKDGRLMTSFSDCPAGLQLKIPGDIRPGTGWKQLREELDRGTIWSRAAMIYHLLPVSRLIRIFTTDGTPMREVQLQPPPSSHLVRQFGLAGANVGNDTVWRAFALPDGFLVQWLSAEAQSGTVQKMPYLCVHDAEGKPVSNASTLPWRQSAPIHVDAGGKVYFLRKAAGGRHELVIARLALR